MKHGLAAHLRVARTRSSATTLVLGHEEGTRSRRSSASAPSTTRFGEMEGASRRTRNEECRNAFPRHVEGARAHLAQGGPSARRTATRTPLDKYVYKVFLDHFPKDKDAYDMSFYYRRAPVDARELEGRGRAVHEGRRDQSAGQVRQGTRPTRPWLAWKERAQRRRSRAARARRERPREDEGEGGEARAP